MQPTLLELYRRDPDRFRIYMFDIDGTLLLAKTPIPGAVEFLDELRRDKKTFFFLTNNSRHTAVENAEKLCNAGIKALPEEIVSCTSPADNYFRTANHSGREWKYFILGDLPDIPGVVRFVQDLDALPECDGVIHCGGVYDWRVTFTALVNFFIRKPEIPLIVANPDILNPVKDGFHICSNGQMELLIRLLQERGIEKKRIYFGKPYAPIYDAAMARVPGLEKERKKAVAVGDWLNSDICGANRFGFSSCLVLTGLSSLQDAENASGDFKPDLVVRSLA